jgi:hypothetical protein
MQTMSQSGRVFSGSLAIVGVSSGGRTMRIRSLISAVALATELAGCAFGVTQKYDEAKTDLTARSATLTVAVLDHRPYVIDKNKLETFTGLSRGGFGNPFDVSTASGQPLASDMAKALEKSFADKGTKVSIVTMPPETSEADAQRKVATPGGKGLLVVLKEWKSDTYATTALHYDVEALVIDSNGRAVARNSVTGVDNLGAGLDVRNNAPVAAFGPKMRQLLSAPQMANAL